MHCWKSFWSPRGCGFTELFQNETENKSECANTHSTHDTSVKDTTENSRPSNDESCKLVLQGELSTTELQNYRLLLQCIQTHLRSWAKLQVTSLCSKLEHSEMAINQPVCENIVNATPVNHTQVQHNARYTTRQSVGRDQQRSSSHSGCKPPPFNGKEKWEVWLNRFEDVADRRGWSEDDKLDELLPRLQGTAGDFVFSQLSARIRSSYRRLVTELGNRFKHVEIAKTYQAQFSKRNQKVNESVGDYAVELNRLYDKGHSNRPHAIRQEDLLRRFLDGLFDHKARQQVEFVQQPQSIEEAVTEVVTFLESSKKK